MILDDELRSLRCPNEPSAEEKKSLLMSPEKHENFVREFRVSVTARYLQNGRQWALDRPEKTARDVEPLTPMRCETCGAEAIVRPYAGVRTANDFSKPKRLRELPREYTGGYDGFEIYSDGSIKRDASCHGSTRRGIRHASSVNRLRRVYVQSWNEQFYMLNTKRGWREFETLDELLAHERKQTRDAARG